MSKIKEIFNDFSNEDKLIKELSFDRGNKRNAFLIALGVSLFFILPFGFMIHNLLFLGNYEITKFLVVIIIFILVFVSRFVYYDVLKYYNKEVRNIKLVSGHILYLILTTILSIMIIIIL